MELNLSSTGKRGSQWVRLRVERAEKDIEVATFRLGS